LNKYLCLYIQEECGTPADKMENQVPEEIKHKRFDRLKELVESQVDFYEMFFEDATLASRELEITLTGKDCGQEERAPMCRSAISCSKYVYRKVNRKRI